MFQFHFDKLKIIKLFIKTIQVLDGNKSASTTLSFLNSFFYKPMNFNSLKTNSFQVNWKNTLKNINIS